MQTIYLVLHLLHRTFCSTSHRMQPQMHLVQHTGCTWDAMVQCNQVRVPRHKAKTSQILDWADDEATMFQHSGVFFSVVASLMTSSLWLRKMWPLPNKMPHHQDGILLQGAEDPTPLLHVNRSKLP